ADLRPTMSAAIVETVETAIAVPGHNDRIQTEPRREEIAGTFDLTFVTDEKPRILEDSQHLGCKQDGIGIETPMHASVAHEVLHLHRTKFSLAHDLACESDVDSGCMVYCAGMPWISTAADRTIPSQRGISDRTNAANSSALLLAIGSCPIAIIRSLN